MGQSGSLGSRTINSDWKKWSLLEFRNILEPGLKAVTKTASGNNFKKKELKFDRLMGEYPLRQLNNMYFFPVTTCLGSNTEPPSLLAIFPANIEGIGCI